MGLAQGRAGARIAGLFLIDHLPEGRAHLPEPRFEIAVELGIGRHGPGPDFAAGFRQVVPRAVQQSGQTSALQAQVLRPTFDGLELDNAPLSRLVGQVRLVGVLHHVRGAPAFPHRGGGAVRLIRRLSTPLDGGRVCPFGRFTRLTMRVLRRQVGCCRVQVSRCPLLRRAGLFQCLLRRAQARPEFRFGGQPALQVRGLYLQQVARLGVVLDQRAQALHGLLELGGAQDGVEARLT